MIVVGFGIGTAFNPVLMAAMSDVEPSETGLASGVANTAFMMGGALGLAILASLAASRTDSLRAAGETAHSALVGGYHLAFVAGAACALAASAVATILLRKQPAAEPAPVEAPAAKGEGESKESPILPVDGPLRADDKVPPGQGMLEVVAGTSDSIFIDGTLVGNGPIVKRALAPKKEPYEIRVKLRGEERVRFVLVKEARLTRLRIAPPWSR
jgi:MFS family permease